MNYQPLTHLHGALLRPCVESELGLKMVKWIQAIECVENVQSINQGEGGYAENQSSSTNWPAAHVCEERALRFSREGRIT
jgi:methionine sulfoxide reductase catalytic subunit